MNPLYSTITAIFLVALVLTLIARHRHRKFVAEWRAQRAADHRAWLAEFDAKRECDGCE